MRNSRSRRGLAVAAALAVTAGLAGALGATSAQAGTTVTEGDFDWGFRASFRTYVANQTAALPPIGPVPVGERIVPQAPAVFNTSGTPSSPGNDETLPFTFPVSGSEVVSTDDLDVQADGAVVFAFPSHAFTVTVAQPRIVIDAGEPELRGDLTVEIPPNDLGYPEGVHGGTDVVLGDITTVSTTIADDGTSATITGSGITLTPAGADALQNFLTEGAELDDFTATVQLDEPVGAAPAISVDTSVVNPAGDTITVTGSGFDPTAAIGTRPPASGLAAGAYVVFGTFLDNWKPSEGAPSSARKVHSQRWAISAATEQASSMISFSDPQYVLLAEDGSFTATVQAQRGFDGALANGNYGIYTYPGSGAAEPSFETFTPISFTAPTASSPAEGSLVQPGDAISLAATGFDADEVVDVVLHSTPTTIGTVTAGSDGEVFGEVTIPGDTEVGPHELYLVGQESGVEVLVASFTVGSADLTAQQIITTTVVDTGALTMSVAGETVVLPTPQLSSDVSVLETDGAINTVTVTDLRAADPGWTVTGVLGDFAGTDVVGSFDGDALTWTPQVASTGSGQVVDAGAVSTLTGGATLATGQAGAGRGTAELGADVDLVIPTTVDPGTYAATLTLTVV